MYVSSASDLCQIKPEKCINHKAQNAEYAMKKSSPRISWGGEFLSKLVKIICFTEQQKTENTLLLVIEDSHQEDYSTFSPFLFAYLIKESQEAKSEQILSRPSNIHLVSWDKHSQWL